jgi:hypothetical protein
VIARRAGAINVRVVFLEANVTSVSPKERKTEARVKKIEEKEGESALHEVAPTC